MHKKNLIVILTIAFTVTVLSAEEMLTFGVLPSDRADNLSLYDPIIRQLEESLGLRVQLYSGRDYRDLLEKIDSGLVDVAHLSGMLYVEAVETIPGMKYVATQGIELGPTLSFSYNSVIVGLKSEGITTLADLEGRNFGVVDRDSSSGYIYPMMGLEENDIDPDTFFNRVFMLGRQTRVVDALVRGSIEGGAMADVILREMQLNEGDLVNVLWESEDIPHVAVVAAPHVSDELRRRLQDAYGNMVFEDASDSQIEINGYRIFSDSYYDPIRAANRFVERNIR